MKLLNMGELFELVAEHPVVALFLAYCTGWIIQTIISVVKPCDCEEK